MCVCVCVCGLATSERESDFSLPERHETSKTFRRGRTLTKKDYFQTSFLNTSPFLIIYISYYLLNTRKIYTVRLCKQKIKIQRRAKRIKNVNILTYDCFFFFFRQPFSLSLSLYLLQAQTMRRVLEKL